MKKYDQLILTELIDKYENSKLSKAGSNKNINITIKANHVLLKDYWSEESYLYKDQIHMILDNLIKQNFIKVLFNRNKELDSITLNIEFISEIYHYLKRTNPEENRKEILEFLDLLKSDSPIILEFKEAMIDKLISFKSVQAYFSSIDDLKLYIKAIEAMILLEEDILKRNFSKKIFNDSKLFEQIESKVLKIIREFSEEDIKDDNELLSFYHIVKTPTFAYIKGGLVIKVNEQVIDLGNYGHEIAFSSSAILDLHIMDIPTKKVITIENLTTFVSFDNPEYIIIYLGGFHNSVKRTLLNKIRDFDANIEFYHFGDIDAGGLLIFEDLVAKTHIEFVPYMMNITTLENYKDYWIKLTKNDKIRLDKMVNGRFSKLVTYMLEKNCKLEQEAIQLN